MADDALSSQDYTAWPAGRAPATPPRRVLGAAAVATALVSCATAALALAHWPSLSGVLSVLVDDDTPLVDLCIFVHGAGCATNAPPSESDPTYWGRVHEILEPHCAAFRFWHADTLNAGWEDTALQQSACDLLHDATNSSSMAIFAHSLGNLILAGALDAGLCTLPPTAHWFAIAAPWVGTRAADVLPSVCAPASQGVLPGLVRSLARRQHFCDGRNGTPSAGYLSTANGQPRLRELGARWRERVDGTLCGDDAFGLWSRDSAELAALSEFARFGEPNDGAVPTGACRPTNASAETGGGGGGGTAHLLAHANHYDLTCRHGDAALPWSGEERKPCAWFEAMATRVRTAAAPPASKRRRQML